MLSNDRGLNGLPFVFPRKSAGPQYQPLVPSRVLMGLPCVKHELFDPPNSPRVHHMHRASGDDFTAPSRYSSA
jgi:hypothetical protein